MPPCSVVHASFFFPSSPAHGRCRASARQVSFANDYKETATRRITFTTPRGSAYAFRDNVYTRWYHESLKKGAAQQRTIYSSTYCFGP